MAVLTHPVKLYTLRISFVKKLDQAIERLLPRPCMLVSASLVLAGLSIPILMASGFLPLSLGLCFLGLVLVGAGCVAGLILCGEL